MTKREKVFTATIFREVNNERIPYTVTLWSDGEIREYWMGRETHREKYPFNDWVPEGHLFKLLKGMNLCEEIRAIYEVGE